MDSQTPASPTRFAVLATQAEKVASRYADEAENLRKRADTWGKSLATTMTVAIGWVTWSRATDVYPHEGDTAFYWSVACLAMMGLSALILWLWYGYQTRPLPMSVDIEHMMKAPKLLSKKEAVVVERVYDGLKKANSLSIKDYANLAMTKELAAENKRDDTKSDGRRDLDDATVAEYLDRAAQIRAEVYATQKQAQVTIIRRRISGLLSGIVTTSAVALFIAGLIGVSYSVDSIDAGRGTEKGHLELLKECAATVKVLQDAKIPVTAAPTSGSAAPLPASPQPAAAAAGTPLPSAAQLPAECGLPAR